MNKINTSEWLWVEKYRPQTIDDCILPSDLKNTLNGFIKDGQLPNLMFSGTAGLGKTTVAKAMCDMLGLDWILINGSEESGIDVLRNKIRQFASTVSLSGGYKVVILDEADYLQAGSTQVALRGFIEEFSNNCRFILTCNFKNRIIRPLHSRCSVVDFNTDKKTLAKLASDFMKRMTFILKNENVSYNEKLLAELIIRFAPDWRRVINECQRYSGGDQLLAAVAVGNNDESISELVKYLKEKDFKAMRGWVVNNSNLDSSVVFRKLYDGLYQFADHSSIPNIVLILADYSYKDAFMADKELNMVACMTELMCNATWL